MSRVLCIYERDMPTVSIMREYFNLVMQKTGISIVFHSVANVTKNMIDESDVLIFIRPNNYLSSSIAKKAQKAGRFVILFSDDDLLNLPKSLPSIPWRKKAFLKTLENSDIVLSSSKYICDKYGPKAKEARSAIINTVVTDEEIKIIPNKKPYSEEKIIKIVYAAGFEHTALFDSYISPIMQKLYKRYKRKISFSFIGVHPELNQYKDKMDIEYYPPMTLKKYRQFMLEKKYDIALAPLNKDDFSKCKYFNKFLEYTLVGAVGIYTNAEPYTYVISDKVNGYLADNTEDGWYNAFCTAIDDNTLRSECLYNSISKLANDFNFDVITGKLLKDIPELSKEGKDMNNCESFVIAKLLHNLSRVADSIYLFFYYLFRKGIKGLINRIRVHFKHRKVYN